MVGTQFYVISYHEEVFMLTIMAMAMAMTLDIDTGSDTDGG
jgi:hypothetical protein